MKHAIQAFFLVAIMMMFMISCENDYPSSLWDPDAPSGATPIITAIIPPDSAYAGIGEIIINGKNFSSQPEENLVFFSGKKAIMIAATETQLTVKTPNVVGDSLQIKIAVHKVELFSIPFVYKLKAAVVMIGNLAENLETAYAIDLDKSENIFVSIDGKKVKKITSDGATTLHSEVSFLRANGMKMGPGNTLYCAFAAGRVKKIATIAPDGTEGTFVSFSGIPQDLDFDVTLNLWVAVGKDMYLVKPDKSSKLIKSFPLTLRTVRVFEGYLYISGREESTGEAKLWRCQIQGETLGAEELLLDLATSSWLSGIVVNSFTFSADGEIYLATNNSDGIFIYRPADNSHELLFPGLIGPNIYALSWGEKQYLYVVQQLTGLSNVLKIDLGKKGAPYYGRP